MICPLIPSAELYFHSSALIGQTSRKDYFVGAQTYFPVLSM